jgi:signal transduction histidine kinase
LKVSLEKEKELSEMKSRFITMASHEFRTPLSTMLLSVQLLKKYQTNESQEKVDKHLKRIELSIQVLNDILNDFLTVGKIQEGKYVYTPVTFNLKEHISSIIKEFDNTGQEAAQISYRHSGNEMVFLDPFLSQHIITNLLSNAIKFSTKKALVEVKSEWLKSHLVLSVKDHGMGIPVEYRKHLFEQFYRASNATNIQGTGLGLFTVNKYVELMKGTIRYSSKLNKGTCFIITI